MAAESAKLYRARGLPEAQALAARLAAAGVPAVVDDGHPAGVIGEAPVTPRVLVTADRLPAARAVLDQFLRPAGGPACLACAAPMGEAADCPACGWTYWPELADPEPPAAPQPAAARAEPVVGSAGPPRSRRALWAEVAVVLVVEWVPRLLNPVLQAAAPAPPLPYWADTLELTVLSGCTAFVVLYLIARSGESWDRFGLGRPRTSDVAAGLGMVVVSMMVSSFAWRLGLFAAAPTDSGFFPPPSGAADLPLGVVKFAAGGFAEELIYRAYLITRLAALLRSRGRALVAAAGVFAAAHAYQGPAGVFFTFLFGLAYGGVFLWGRRVWPLALGHALTNLMWDFGRWHGG